MKVIDKIVEKIQQDDFEGFEKLLKRWKWFVNFKDSKGRVLLNYALFAKSPEYLKILLKLNANPYKKNSKGYNSFHYSLYSPYLEILLPKFKKDFYHKPKKRWFLIYLLTNKSHILEKVGANNKYILKHFKKSSYAAYLKPQKYYQLILEAINKKTINYEAWLGYNYQYYTFFLNPNTFKNLKVNLSKIKIDNKTLTYKIIQSILYNYKTEYDYILIKLFTLLPQPEKEIWEYSGYRLNIADIGLATASPTITFWALIRNIKPTIKNIGFINRKRHISLFVTLRIFGINLKLYIEQYYQNKKRNKIKDYQKLFEIEMTFLNFHFSRDPKKILREIKKKSKTFVFSERRIIV